MSPCSALLVLTLLLASCAPLSPRPGGSTKAAAASGGERPRPLVITTVLPITLFTRAVAGSCADVRPLLDGSGSAHDLQATPTQLARLRQARVLVVNGLGLESQLDRLVAGAGNPRLLLIDASRSLDEAGASPAFQALPDSSHAHSSHDHEHRGELETVNPHVWLDPQRAARQVEAIRDGLIAADPGCRRSYSANAAIFLAELKLLDADLARQLAPYAGQSFLAFHDLAPYFAERYRLKAEYLVDLPDQNPSAADLQRLQRQVKSSGLRALISEPQAGSRALGAIAADLGLPVLPFDPLETAPSSGPGTTELSPSYYGETMRRNARNLVNALGG